MPQFVQRYVWIDSFNEFVPVMLLSDCVVCFFVGILFNLVFLLWSVVLQSQQRRVFHDLRPGTAPSGSEKSESKGKFRLYFKYFL